MFSTCFICFFSSLQTCTVSGMILKVLCCIPNTSAAFLKSFISPSPFTPKSRCITGNRNVLCLVHASEFCSHNAQHRISPCFGIFPRTDSSSAVRSALLNNERRIRYLQWTNPIYFSLRHLILPSLVHFSLHIQESEYLLHTLTVPGTSNTKIRAVWTLLLEITVAF